MENKKLRVLAYRLAKVLDKNALADVSGGMNTHQTFYPSGTDKTTVDYRYDY